MRIDRVVPQSPAERSGTLHPGDALRIDHLDVRFGTAHVLQDVSLSLTRGILSLVGRNGMGKTTLCRAIVGLIPTEGSISTYGRPLSGLEPAAVARLGVGYVPQGRRLWPSLTVDEHIRLMEGLGRRRPGRSWNSARIYERFPGLLTRRNSEASKLSGGEQQMLSISRALLSQPTLLVMDEPTEGLAPVVVEQVVELIRELAASDGMSVLLIEQNLGVALELADHVAVLTNGRMGACMPASDLADNPGRQRELLGFS